MLNIKSNVELQVVTWCKSFYNQTSKFVNQPKKTKNALEFWCRYKYLEINHNIDDSILSFLNFESAGRVVDTAVARQKQNSHN